MMNLKQLFRYSCLPILAVLIIPHLAKGTIPNEVDVIMAIIAGTITGGIRYWWEASQHRKQKIDS